MINRFFNRTIYVQAAIIIGCLFFFSCENTQAELDRFNNKVAMVDEARDVITLLSQGGEMRARLIAPLMLRYQKDTSFVEFPKTLKVDFYDSTGQVESKLFALYGKYFETQNKVYIRDSVLVYNIKGDTMRTTELWWDQNTRLFYNDKPTYVKRGNGDAFVGRNGMMATQDLSDITFLDAKGSFAVKDSL
jgi:LPS export ABC transporter protein LptC